MNSLIHGVHLAVGLIQMFASHKNERLLMGVGEVGL